VIFDRVLDSFNYEDPSPSGSQSGNRTVYRDSSHSFAEDGDGDQEDVNKWPTGADLLREKFW
jgi:hypothetical protein